MIKTTVQWLWKQIDNTIPFQNIIIKQAKEVERIQIIDASATAYEDMFGANGNEYGENYYNKQLTIKNK